MKTLHNLLDEYLESLESLRYSVATMKSIRYNCRECLDFLRRNHEVYENTSLGRKHLQCWQQHLARWRTARGLPLKARSVNKRIENVRGFLKYLAEYGYIQKRIADTPRYVKQPVFLPMGVLENRNVRRMLNAIDTTNATGYRDRTILELMYSCGLRASEIVSLNIDNVDFTHAVLRVTGKGDKQRAVPVGKTALRCLQTYIQAIRPFAPGAELHDALFLNQTGTRLRYHTLRLIVAEHAAKSGSPEHVTTHTFRRSCATELIRGGANLYHVKELLGHDDLQSLKHYTKLTINELRKTHAKYHPSEKSS